jgi:superfamily II DNA/RNA helicase
MKRTVNKITNGLKKDGVNAAAIHGDLPQGKRNTIMRQLRSGKLHVLVASDLAARGIDVDGITHVINFDLPEDPEIYVHRIGRTARAGRGGVAFSFVSSDQGPLLTEVEKLANTHIPPYDTHGFEPGPVPKDIEKERVSEEKRRESLKARNRYTASRPELPSDGGGVDPNKFPGGVVPTKLPKRRLGGKVKTSRVVKAEAAAKNTTSDDA